MIIHSHMRHLIKNCCSYSFGDTISTTNTPKLSTLPPPGTEYMCFQTEGGSAHAEQFDQSRSLIKVLKAIFYIDSFEQQCFIIKGLLQSKQLENRWLPLGFTNN